MMLRWLVSNWVRQTAQQKFYEAVSQAAPVSQRSEGEQAARDSAGEASAAPPPCEIAFLFALGVEAGGLVDSLEGCVTTRCPSFLEHAGRLVGHQVIVAESGVGREAAARATADLIRIHRPPWIVSAGFAGALCPELRRGHILMAEEVLDTRGQSLNIGLKMDRESLATTPSLHVGRLLTVDQLIRTRDARQQLAEQYDALACDMETIAVADVCARQQVRFMSVRIVSDAVEDELPKEIERMLDQKSLAGKLGAVTGAIFNRPSSVKDMWKLKEEALKATDRLARFLVGVSAELTA